MIGILFFLSQKSTSHKVYPDHNINSDITKNKHVQLPPWRPGLAALCRQYQRPRSAICWSSSFLPQTQFSPMSRLSPLKKKKKKRNIMKYKPRALSCRVGVGKCFKCTRIEAVTWHPSSVTLYLNFFLLFAPSQSPLNVVRRMALSLLFDWASR